MKLSIRIQFILLTVIILGSAIGSTTYYFTSHSKKAILKERVLRGQSILRSWASLCHERILVDDISLELGMYDFMDNVLKYEKAITSIYLQDTEGMVILHHDATLSNTKVENELDQPFSSIEVDGMSTKSLKEGVTQFNLYSPLFAEKKLLAIARVSMTDEGIDQEIKDGLVPVWILSAVVLVFALILILALVYTITRPITELVEGAKIIGTEKDEYGHLTLQHRIEFNSHSELAELRDAFNEMTQNLSQTLHDKEVLTQEKEDLTVEKNILKEQATTDGMTGLFNKRQFLEDFTKLLKLSKTRKVPLTLMMLDMDDFKKLNDTVGHKAGDVALINLAKCINKRVHSKMDRSYRVGGDEFVIILVGKHKETAHQQSIRISELYDATKAPENMTTISFGIVQYNYQDTTEAFYQKADEAMYKTKTEKKAMR